MAPPNQKFVIDPQDRRPVDYWSDAKFITYLTLDGEKREAFAAKQKKGKVLKTNKPLVRVLPLLEALRNNRYCEIRELIVYDVLMDHSDLMSLAAITAKGTYKLEILELINCFIDAKGLEVIVPTLNSTHSLSTLILDFNEFGDNGCHVLCEGLAQCKWLVTLSMRFCDLHKQSGLWLGNLICETPIRELYVDGNSLEAEGAIALLYQLSEAANKEGMERADAERAKIEAALAAKNTRTRRVDLDAPPDDPPPQPANASNVDEGEHFGTNVNAAKGGKKKKGSKMPPSGPQISILYMSENAINSIGRGGSFAPVRAMQLLKTIIAYSKTLMDVNIFGNEIGDLAARQLLEGLLLRLDAKLPKIGLKVSHQIHQDTFDAINQLAPGPKIKRK
ncbi:unnamed protein product [Dibothriocephalus latus]|uniref:Uncharacterized protein n=1 Tax=Dibothriocephalus latus TaxID=60516 RepID=A0A3P6TIN0_DIBLA|nr:unnamed protein product [Dibothriocephalus latus]